MAEPNSTTAVDNFRSTDIAIMEESDAKNTNAYIDDFQRRKKMRIVSIATGVLLVLGIAVAVIFASEGSSVDASQSSGQNQINANGESIVGDTSTGGTSDLTIASDLGETTNQVPETDGNSNESNSLDGLDNSSNFSSIDGGLNNTNTNGTISGENSTSTEDKVSNAPVTTTIPTEAPTTTPEASTPAPSHPTNPPQTPSQIPTEAPPAPTSPPATPQPPAPTSPPATTPPPPVNPPVTPSPPRPTPPPATPAPGPAPRPPPSEGNMREQIIYQMKVIRGAHGLGPVSWNSDLASKMQAWADSCPQKNGGGHGGPPGNQNLAGFAPCGNDCLKAPGAVWTWYDSEEEEWNYDTNQSKDGDWMTTGHFQNSMDPGVNEIACGWSTCYNPSIGKDDSLVWCNYLGGNNGIIPRPGIPKANIKAQLSQ